MKLTVAIARYTTGLLFIFSGLVKAIDPHGLAYKMQEFFEAWANAGFIKNFMKILEYQALGFSIFMITLEVLVGLAILFGWQKKIITWLLFLMILFFTFLTSYVLFSGKIKACGCFGDCIPLTPIQTFTKDIILLALALILLFNKKYILPAAKPFILFIVILLATIATLGLQWYVMKYLPLADCLPYKEGNNLIELRKMPKNAVPDKYAISFIYEKNGAKKEFAADALPDSSWQYAERQQKLVMAGKNNVALINDFSFTTLNGTDTTEAILNQPGIYYLLIIKDLAGISKSFNQDQLLVIDAAKMKIPFFIVTPAREITNLRYNNLLLQQNLQPPPIFTCDGTAIKTAARAAMVLYKMKAAVVQEKWGWGDFDKVKM